MVYAKGAAAAEVAAPKGPLVQRGLAARKRRLGDCDLARASTSTRQATIPPSRLRRATSLYTREAFSLCYRGEQCSPAGSYAAVKLHGRTLCAPTPQSSVARRGGTLQQGRGLTPSPFFAAYGNLHKRTRAFFVQHPHQFLIHFCNFYRLCCKNGSLCVF